jgi:hypothetical protein
MNSLCNSAGYRKFPNDDMCTPKYLRAVEETNKLSEECICWFIVHTQYENTPHKN